jgi:hypothetical protein
MHGKNAGIVSYPDNTLPGHQREGLVTNKQLLGCAESGISGKLVILVTT